MTAARKAAAKQPAPVVERAVTLLAPLGPVTPRRMFGGWGLFLDGAMIALVTRDRLYFKTDGETAGRFAEAGSEPFSYRSKVRLVTTSYWRAPEDSLDDGRALLAWAELAVAAARRAARKKAAARKPAAKAVRRL